MSPKGKQVKPKLRMAPSSQILADQQAAAYRLLMLDAWTDTPSEPPPAEVAATVVAPHSQAAEPHSETPAPVRVVKPELKPWESDDAARAHPYHLVMNEGLFQKLDFVWKRAGYKSMRELVLQTLEAMADKDIKKLSQ